MLKNKFSTKLIVGSGMFVIIVINPKIDNKTNMITLNHQAHFCPIKREKPEIPNNNPIGIMMKINIGSISMAPISASLINFGLKHTFAYRIIKLIPINMSKQATIFVLMRDGFFTIC